MTQALCMPVESAINHALKYDPATQYRLAEYSGKVIRVSVNGATSVTVRLLDDGLHLSMNDEVVADASLFGPAIEFLQMVRSQDPALLLSTSSIQSSGDIQLIEALLAILADLDIDWEGMLEPFMGSMAAYAIGSRVRSFANWSQQTGESLRMSARDFVLDEMGSRPATPPGFDALKNGAESLFSKFMQSSPFASQNSSAANNHFDETCSNETTGSNQPDSHKDNK